MSFDYNNGPKQATAAAQGLGFLQRYLAFLTEEYIEVFNSSTNATLDGNREITDLTQPIMLSASHDTMISTGEPTPY